MSSLRDNALMLNRFYLLALIVLLSVGLRPAQAQAPSTDILDTLPACGYTAAAPDDNILVGAVAYNLQTGAGCAENLDTLFPVASVPKVFVAAAFFQTVLETDGLINFQTPITFSDRYWMSGRNSCLDVRALNAQVPAGELSDMMIACSDNAATWMLMDALGWQTVDSYVDSLDIPDIGRVIPYSEVDRQKLVFLDERWRQVPIAAASRFYRSRNDNLLLTSYFDQIPRYNRDELVAANARYFDETTYNTITPRAMAAYLFKLAEDAPQNTNDGQVARWLFNTMLLTQRQYTAQAVPGQVTVGAKNGFDTGLRAEVNVMFNRLPGQQRNPTAFSIVFIRQQNLDVPNMQPATNRDDAILNSYLLDIAPTLGRTLYADTYKPGVTNDNRLSTIVVNPTYIIDTCWATYADRGYLLEARGALEVCLLNQGQRPFQTGDGLGLAFTLYNLDELDARLTYVFTEPNGEAHSYQDYRLSRESDAVYWFHPIGRGQGGTWTVDVYLDQRLVYTTQVDVS